jgi:nucleotide-binding universal stress UspA family protein
MFQTILVPVDFSACSDAAFKVAQRLAQQFGSRLVLLHVWEPPRFADGSSGATVSGQPIADYARRQSEPKMTELLNQLPPGLRERTHAEFDIGQPWERLLARAKQCDLTVMGTHGHTGRVRSLAGSVAESMVRLSPKPVLTVRNPD